MNAQDLPALNAAVDKLLRLFIDAEEFLRLAQTPEARATARQHLRSVTTRLTRAERLQEAALCAPPVSD